MINPEKSPKFTLKTRKIPLKTLKIWASRAGRGSPRLRQQGDFSKFYLNIELKQASPIGGWGVLPPTPPRDGPKNQLTFLFKAFFSFFSLIISYTL